MRTACPAGRPQSSKVIKRFMKKVILVEDNPDNAELVVDMLSDLYDIERYSSAVELLTILYKPETEKPDIFILDISLPGMDGVTLMRKIKEEAAYQDVPMLALTAHAMKDDKRRFIDSGFDGYVSKPIVDEELLTSEIIRVINLKKS